MHLISFKQNYLTVCVFVLSDIQNGVGLDKSSFLCNFWSWPNMYIVDRPRSLVDFLTWMWCR